MFDTDIPRVLVADDQSDVVLALRLLLRDAGLEVDAARSIQEIRSSLATTTYDLVLMDLNYARDTTSGSEGLELLAEIHSRDPLLPVFVMTGWGSIDTAVDAMRRGARTFVHKPWDNSAIVDSIRREVQDGRAKRRAGHDAVRDHEEAQAIQRALLPSELPALAGCEVAARWIPASAFGGDCYDVARLSDHRLALCIADVCGKGLPAALLMATLQASVRAFAAADPSPRTVAARVNHELLRNGPLRRFITFFYALYDPDDRQLTFTNAGHNPPIVIKANGAVVRPAVGGMVLGLFDQSVFEQAIIALGPGDRVVLFTDGLTEACDAGGDAFGDDRLVDTVLRHRAASASVVVESIFNEVRRFSAGAFQDDATVVVLAVQ